jgi:hypothetical protein
MGRPTPQEIKDLRDDAKKERAYNESLTSTEPAPKKSIMPKKAETKAMGEDATDAMAFKKGGMTASKRADGIAQRGKTRGTMVMCGGGMTRK